MPDETPRRRRFDWVRYLLIYIALAISALAVILALNARDQSNDLQTGLIKGCEDTRTPLQAYFQGEADQVTNDHALYEEFFPDVPQDVLDAQLAKQAEQLNELVRVFDPDDCVSLYE